MCKSPEPDTSPEARERSAQWFKEKRRQSPRAWPPFAALPAIVARRLAGAR